MQRFPQKKALYIILSLLSYVAYFTFYLMLNYFMNLNSRSGLVLKQGMMWLRKIVYNVKLWHYYKFLSALRMNERYYITKATKCYYTPLSLRM